jgi:membrane protease subunit (stomatin/prohibitin family)
MGNAYTTIKGMELLEALAENPAGGVASAGAGIGMGMAAGSVVSNIAETVFSNSRIVRSQQPQQQNSGGTGRFNNTEGSPCGTPHSTSEPDPIVSLEKMKLMLEKGLIPQAVYDQKVAEILSRL